MILNIVLTSLIVVVTASVVSWLVIDYLRANKEVEQSGSMSIQRAYKIVAYFGYVKNSDSRGVRKKYNVDMLHSIAKSLVSNYQRKINKRRLTK